MLSTARAGLLERLGQDFRYGVRLLRLNPGFAAAAILSLALGIAANTSIFALTDQILLRLLPVENPRELVQFRMEGGRFGSQNGDGLHTFSYPLYTAFRDRNTVFSGLTGQYTERLGVLDGDRAEMIETGWVAANFFHVLGVKPFIGRVLAAEDDRPGAGAAVVVLQHGFWQSRYNGQRDVLGSTIRLNGAPFTVVGVAAPEFGGTNMGLLTQLWAPVTARSSLATDPQMRAAIAEDMKNERYAWFYLVARMKPGVTLPQAEAALRVLHEQRKQEELSGEFFAKFPDTKEREEDVFVNDRLPLLWRDRVLGWANLSVRADRLDVEVGFVASRPPRDRAFRRELEAELDRMREFLELPPRARLRRATRPTGVRLNASGGLVSRFLKWAAPWS